MKSLNTEQGSAIRSLQMLIRLPAIKPNEIADLVGRKLQLEYEDEFVLRYTLVGGPALPFNRGSAYWLKKLERGECSFTLDKRCRIPMAEAIAHFGGVDLFSPLFPDPRNPNPIFASIRRIPLGELRLLYRDPKSDYQLTSFIVSQMFALDWGADS
jgi:hypothetical protein